MSTSNRGTDATGVPKANVQAFISHRLLKAPIKFFYLVYFVDLARPISFFSIFVLF